MWSFLKEVWRLARWWLVVLPLRLFEDRLFAWANLQIDQSYWLRAVMDSWIGITGAIFLSGVLLSFLIAAMKLKRRGPASTISQSVEQAKDVQQVTIVGDHNVVSADKSPVSTAENLFKKSLPSWSELETRFGELERVLQLARIDGQTGAAGEHWQLSAILNNDAGRRFKALSAMASARLFQDFPSEIDKYPELKSESDPIIRWYKALKFIGGSYVERHQTKHMNEDGSSTGYVYTGSIQGPASASATLCLELASRETENGTR